MEPVCQRRPASTNVLCNVVIRGVTSRGSARLRCSRSRRPKSGSMAPGVGAIPIVGGEMTDLALGSHRTTSPIESRAGSGLGRGSERSEAIAIRQTSEGSSPGRVQFLASLGTTGLGNTRTTERQDYGSQATDGIQSRVTGRPRFGSSASRLPSATRTRRRCPSLRAEGMSAPWQRRFRWRRILRRRCAC